MPSMHQMTVPALIRGLGVLAGYVDAAAAFSAERGLAHDVLMTARLAPDMLTFTGQIQRASDNAKSGAARLIGATAPSFPDVEADFPALRQRLAATDAFLRELAPGQFDDAETRTLEMAFRSITGTLSGQTYLTQVLLPNFYFHIATAHGILRAAGLDVGKRNYLGTAGAVPGALIDLSAA
ncbi:DUF1993 domain-containing protein [Caulobacter segnis]